MHASAVAIIKGGREENKPGGLCQFFFNTCLVYFKRLYSADALSVRDGCCVCVRGAASVLVPTLDWNHVSLLCSFLTILLCVAVVFLL